MTAPLRPSEATAFPYAIVEIKLQAAPPSWVQGLLDTGAGLGCVCVRGRRRERGLRCCPPALLLPWLPGLLMHIGVNTD